MENFFHNNLCHVCKKPHMDLKRCSSCKILCYCSKDHQLQDWKNHKQLCKIITESEKILDYNISNFSDFKRYNICKSVLWQTKLERQLKPYESQMWMFPRFCSVCYSLENLQACNECLSIFYCSENHKIQYSKQHSYFCSALKLNVAIDSYLFHNSASESMSQELILKEISNANDYLPDNILEFVSLLLDQNSDTSNEYGNIKKILVCDGLASGATILFALEKAFLLNKRILYNSLVRASLTVHIVGASNFELSLQWTKIFEMLFHWITNLNLLNIILIGPDMPAHNERTDNYINVNDEFCFNCKDKHVKTMFKTLKNVYHEIVNDVEKPDLIILFNSGLHEFENSDQDMWKQSLTSLTNPKVPILLTGYTKDELDKDLNRFIKLEDIGKGKDVLIIWEPQKNPYANLRPLRDWSSDDNPVFYINGFVSIIVPSVS